MSLLAMWVAAGLITMAPPPVDANPAPEGDVQAEVQVTFEGDQEVAVPDGEEVEVTFAEEIDPDGFVELPPLPEYDRAPWLAALPVLCVALIAWNVRWRSGPRRHARNRERPRT